MPNSIHKTSSSKETEKLGGLSAKKNLTGKNKKNALVLALSGDLGSGKTTFIRGFLKSLGIRKKITSPTFVLIKRYNLKIKNYKTIYHIDCYRIKKSGELIDLGLEEILKNPQNIVLIEWPEKIRRLLPENSIWLKFRHGQKENIREIKISGK